MARNAVVARLVAEECGRKCIVSASCPAGNSVAVPLILIGVSILCLVWLFYDDSSKGVVAIMAHRRMYSAESE